MPSFQCPTCNRELKVERREDAPFRPFCSKRCKLIDLYKWFEGEYRISDPLPSPPLPGQQPSAQAEDEET